MEESGEPQKPKEDKSVTSQVLDYYKCFSQNRELPKYFCGTAEIEIQDWKPIPAVSPPLLTIPVSEALPAKDIPLIHIENVCIPSPVSSVASNRKLEWDNGADIGYSNSTLHKSVSLPVLTDSEYTKLRNKLLSQNAENKEDTHRSVEVHCTEAKFSDLSSTSESVKSSPKEYILTTPSSGGFFSDSGSSKAQRLKSLTEKVGLPIAQSTRLIDEIECLTPNTNDRTKIDLGAIDRISCYKNLKLLKLSASKPVVVECAGWTRPPRGKSKTVQTSLSLNAVSVGIQTDFDLENCEVIVPTREAAERQNVFYICYSDSPTENDSTNCSTIHTQTPTDFSSCDSFQYIHKSQNNAKGSKSESTSESDKENSPKIAPKTKGSDNHSLTNILLNSTRDNRKDGSNIKDLQRTVDLLQKLIRSKKYDSLTKKFYLKAIMKQLVDSKSDSSESVLPRSEVSEDRSDKKITESTKQAVLGKLKTQTFTAEIPPKSAASTISDSGRLKRSRLLTLTDSDLYDTVAVSTNTTTREIGDTKREPNDVHSSLSNKDGRSSAKSWRDDKTRSEKRLEKGAGDCHSLEKITKKDLSDGIKEVSQSAIAKELQKPHADQLNGVSKTTTVYVLSTEKESTRTQNEPSTSVAKRNPCACSCRCSSFKPSNVVNTVIEVGGDTIHLQDAHLISSEEFTSNNGNARCTTVVRRYTFEIPLAGAQSKKVTPVYINDNVSGLKMHKSVGSGNLSELSENSKKSEVSGNSKKSKRSSKDSSKRSNGSSREHNEIHMRRDSTSHKSEFPSEPHETIKSQKKSSGCGQCSSHEKISKNQLSSNESAKQPGGKDSVTESEVNLTNKLDGKRSVTNIPKAKDDATSYSTQSETTSDVICTASCCSLGPKSFDHLTGELVYADEIPSSYQIEVEHMPVQENKSGRNGSLSKELVYSDSIPSTTNQGSEKIVIELCDCGKTSKSSSSSTCVCCKERQVQTVSKCCQCGNTQSAQDSEKYILCYPCYNYHQQFVGASQPYFTEGYVCQCQTKQDTIKEIKKTIQQLQNLESETELCHCNGSCEEVISSTNFCEHCNCRLRPRYRRRKGGLAYCVTLESDQNLASNEQTYPMEPLEEIKIKVPSASPSPTSDYIVKYCNSKSCKRKNVRKCTNLQCTRGGDNSEQATNKMSDPSTNCYCLYFSDPVVSHDTQTTSNKNRNRTNKESRVKSTRNCEDDNFTQKCYRVTDLDQNQFFTESEYPRPKDRKEKLKEKSCTLQEYLSHNKPRFIANADQRRQCLLDLVAVRQEQSEKYKRILATAQKPMSLNTKRSQNVKVKRPFSSREMKQLTAKIYKKCPEVQRKLVDVREREIKKTNKLIYDVFNQNLQYQVLKGRHTLPLEATVVNFY